MTAVYSDALRMSVLLGDEQGLIDDNPVMTNPHERAHRGHPIIITDTQHQAPVDELNFANCNIKQKDITI